METHELDKIDLLTFATCGSDEKDAWRIAAHVAACPACRSFIDTFRSENASFLGSHPYESAIRPVAPAPVPRMVSFPAWRMYGIAASVIIMLTTGYFLQQRAPANASRTKGAVSLKPYVKNARGEIEMRSDQVYGAGERIQFRYSCGGQNKFLLLSIDTTGAVTRYYPVSGDSSEALEPGQDIPLSHSILLDEYIGKELFIGVFSNNKMHAAFVQDSLKTSFNRTKNIDSIGLSLTNATLWKLPIVVVKGTR